MSGNGAALWALVLDTWPSRFWFRQRPRQGQLCPTSLTKRTLLYPEAPMSFLFGYMTYFLLIGGYYILPKTELQSSLWVKELFESTEGAFQKESSEPGCIQNKIRGSEYLQLHRHGGKKWTLAEMTIQDPGTNSILDATDLKPTTHILSHATLCAADLRAGAADPFAR